MQTAATIVSVAFIVILLYGFFRSFWSPAPKRGINDELSSSAGPQGHFGHSDSGGHGGGEGDGGH
jgi:hypothetical protein